MESGFITRNLICVPMMIFSDINKIDSTCGKKYGNKGKFLHDLLNDVLKEYKREE